ncbi:hypothetical protein Tco_0719323 [Tanacetum coccineum]
MSLVTLACDSSEPFGLNHDGAEIGWVKLVATSGLPVHVRVGTCGLLPSVYRDWLGQVGCNIWLARSKFRVGPCGLSEGFGYMVPRVEGNALGWFYRAAKTSRSGQWKDNTPVHP